MAAREAPCSMQDSLLQLCKPLRKDNGVRKLVSSAAQRNSRSPGVDDANKLLAKPGRRFVWRLTPPLNSLCL